MRARSPVKKGSAPTTSAIDRWSARRARAGAISAAVPASTRRSSRPAAAAAVCSVRCWSWVAGFLGFTRAPIGPGAGTSSFISSKRFASSSWLRIDTPVTLPPGRLKLATRPARAGSLTAEKTIGMVEVAAFAASAE